MKRCKNSKHVERNNSFTIEEDPVTVSFVDFINDKKEKTSTMKCLSKPIKSHCSPVKIFKQNNKNKRKRKSNSSLGILSKRKRIHENDCVIIPSKLDLNPTSRDCIAKKQVPKNKKSAKRRQSSADVIEVKETENATSLQNCKQEFIENGEALPLWTEKHKPVSSNDLLVNQMSLTKLKEWLQNWKKQIENECVVHKKYSKCDAKKDILSSSDSDFYLSDEENGKDELSKIFVLVGPSGCGKTATVYTCCSELGYKAAKFKMLIDSLDWSHIKEYTKVLEINASSQRNYKQVMCQLQEATQSHLVIKKSDRFRQQHRDTKNKNIQIDRKSTSKLNRFFGRKPVKNRIQGHTTPFENMNQSSLILFDEVEAVLEVDKGFWPAVQSFTSITKRPIILTTTNDSVLQNLAAPYQVEYIETKLKTKVQSYVCSVAMKEGCPLVSSDWQFLNTFLVADIRSCILSLQFWLPTCSKESKPRNSKNTPSVIQNKSITKYCGFPNMIDELNAVKNMFTEFSQDIVQREKVFQSLENIAFQILIDHSSHYLLGNSFKMSGCQTQHMESPLVIHLKQDAMPGSRMDLIDDCGIDVDMLSFAYNGTLQPPPKKKCEVTTIPRAKLNLKTHECNFSVGLENFCTYLEATSVNDILLFEYSKTFPGSSKEAGIYQLLDGLSDDTDGINCYPPDSVILNFFQHQAFLQVNSLRSVMNNSSQCISFSMNFDNSFSDRTSDNLFQRISHYNGMGANQFSCSAYNVDYAPALRSICRAEKKRKEAKTSRRFFHYFEDIQLHPGAAVVHKLTNDFVVKELPKS